MSSPAVQESQGANSQRVFWGCFIALITTSFAFITRMVLCDGQFKTNFGLDDVGVGALKGAGIWPFGISIILFSLIIDKIGYRIAMFFSFFCYVVYLGFAVMAYGSIQGDLSGDALLAAQQKGLSYLTWGSIILGLGNGTVEAFINPVVATIFNRDKTKWLNILHAGWPGGLVIAGLITIAMSTTVSTGDWRMVLGLIALPAITYLLMLSTASFPKTEREAAGVSYKEMLAEFGAFGALVGFGLIFMELGNTFGIPMMWRGVLTGIVTIAFAAYTQSFGRPILAFLIIIMMPLATTEIGTDGWITGLMAGPMEEAGYNALWVLVYTSAIMMVLRFFAGPIVHMLSPIGMLVISAVLAIAGLLALSKTGGQGLTVIFGAATLYGIGKTFFWPTMLGVTSEQCPKGGALTLNAISGIGMIAVGVLGFPYIGYVKAGAASAALSQSSEEVATSVLESANYMGLEYKAISTKKTADLPQDSDAKKAVDAANQTGEFSALATMAIFPAFMLVCYIGMFLYFKSKGGYQAEVLTGHAADDEKFTGGVEGAVEA
ncbi:MAG: MFS transporter [Planctomycetaceae bacterium]